VNLRVGTAESVNLNGAPLGLPRQRPECPAPAPRSGAALIDIYGRIRQCSLFVPNRAYSCARGLLMVFGQVMHVGMATATASEHTCA
jgi:hypothetical protein